MLSISTLVLSLFLGTCLVYGQTTQQFQAAVTIYNDPNVKGSLSGQLYYDYTNGKQRTDFTIGSKEIFIFSSKLRYLGCGTSCDTQTWKDPQLVFFKENTDSSVASVVVNGQSCNGWQKNNPPTNGITRVYISSNNQICRAVTASGKTFDFRTIQALGASTVFDAYTQWACPAQQCNKQMDIMLVFDESGSIDPPSFLKEKQFGANFANSFTIGSQGVKMGLVMFSGSSRSIITLNNNKQSVVNAINGVSQRNGSTCIGCGIDLAHTQFTNNGRSGVARIIVLLTDGKNNRGTDTFDDVLASARAASITIFTIGVAEADQTELADIATQIAGVQTTFYTPDFNGLAGILDNLIIATCIDIIGNPCGPGCLGFCSCGQTCLCPDACDDGNACTDNRCTPGVNGNGCYYPARTCNDGDYCTDDSCNPSSGCVYNPKVCVDGDSCTVDGCNTAAGCTFTPKDCNDGNVCTQDGCNSGSGCTNVTIPCNLCLQPTPVICQPVKCYDVACDPADGQCKSTRINCDDGNICTNDDCDANTGNCTHTPIVCNDGNACTHDTCDSGSGCIYTPFNVSYECNDYSLCTTDTCDVTRGCVNTPVTCPDDGDPCTIQVCNSLTGCSFQSRDCASEPDIADKLGNCYLALCSKERNGCYLEQIEGTKIDECGYCEGSGKVCLFGLDTNAVAGLSAGVLAAIIIGSVAVCAALGVFGGKKGYDIWMKNRNHMHDANTNPLYSDNGRTGTNPLYQTEAI